MYAPSFSLWLRLKPRHLEELFWRSQVYSQHALALDCYTLYLHIITPLNLLFLPYEELSECFRAPTKALYALLIIIAVIQRVVMYVAQDHYLHRRYFYLLLNRTVRFFLLAYFIYDLRVRLSAGCSFDCLKQTSMANPTPFSPPASAARGLLVASTAILPLLHGCAMPLPFLTQLVTHMATVAMLFIWHLHSAVQLLSHPPCSAQLNQLCINANTLLEYAQELLFSLPVNHKHLHDTCNRQAPYALVTFVVLYFALLIPLYVAYRLERKVKEDFLIHLHVSSPTGVDLRRMAFMPVPHTMDIIVLFTGGILSWLSAGLLCKHLRGIAIPL